MASDAMGIGDFVNAELVDCTQLATDIQEIVPVADGVQLDRFHKDCGGKIIDVVIKPSNTPTTLCTLCATLNAVSQETDR